MQNTQHLATLYKHVIVYTGIGLIVTTLIWIVTRFLLGQDYTLTDGDTTRDIALWMVALSSILPPMIAVIVYKLFGILFKTRGQMFFNIFAYGFLLVSFAGIGFYNSDLSWVEMASLGLMHIVVAYMTLSGIIDSWDIVDNETN